jgi:hypothetical protein
MAIVINHRFLERLTSTKEFNKINIIIIGTFNPGMPQLEKLDAAERSQFEYIRNSKKFIKFNQVKNFYDRPQNRFWKIMDYFNDADFYAKNFVGCTNPNGLKYYIGMDRNEVFKKQQVFCKKHGILITDIAKTINPSNFHNIYDNFPDTTIEKSSPVWNTKEIIAVIKKYKPEKILVNFKSDSKLTPKICTQIAEISKYFPDRIVTSLKSTSGSAGYTYTELIEDWNKHLH